MTRLQTITKAGGFRTDVGKLVFQGEQPVLGPDDPEASLALVVPEDEPGHQAENVVTVIPAQVQAIAKASLSNPWATVEDVIADVRQAVETDHDLAGATLPRGLTRGRTAPLDREAGSEIVGAAVTYFLLVSEQWGTG